MGWARWGSNRSNLPELEERIKEEHAPLLRQYDAH